MFETIPIRSATILFLKWLWDCLNIIYYFLAQYAGETCAISGHWCCEILYAVIRSWILHRQFCSGLPTSPTTWRRRRSQPPLLPLNICSSFRGLCENPSCNHQKTPLELPKSYKVRIVNQDLDPLPNWEGREGVYILASAFWRTWIRVNVVMICWGLKRHQTSKIPIWFERTTHPPK